MQVSSARPVASFLQPSFCLVSLFLVWKAAACLDANTIATAGSKGHNDGNINRQKRHHAAATVSHFLSVCTSDASVHWHLVKMKRQCCQLCLYQHIKVCSSAFYTLCFNANVSLLSAAPFLQVLAVILSLSLCSNAVIFLQVSSTSFIAALHLI